jgi:hypothetical protein
VICFYDGGDFCHNDVLSGESYDRSGNDLQGGGLYLDERPWSARVFALTRG